MEQVIFEDLGRMAYQEACDYQASCLRGQYTQPVQPDAPYSVPVKQPVYQQPQVQVEQPAPYGGKLTHRKGDELLLEPWTATHDMPPHRFSGESASSPIF